MSLLRGAEFPLSALEWTQIILAAMTALTTIICAALSAWVAVQLRSPSGMRVGEMVERTEHLASVNTMRLMQIQNEQLDPGSEQPEHEVG